MLDDLQLALEIVDVEAATIWCEEEWGDVKLGDERRAKEPEKGFWQS